MSVTVTVDSIPHRPPFLFVDEIVEVSPERIVTRKRIDPEADFFRGHYPGNPIMPGVLLCECCFQAGALLIAHRLGGLRPPTPVQSAAKGGVSAPVPVVTRIQDARFKRMVLPGQTVEVEVTLDEELNGAFFLTGRLSVEAKPALRVTFACMLTTPARPEGGKPQCKDPLCTGRGNATDPQSTPHARPERSEGRGSTTDTNGDRT